MNFLEASEIADKAHSYHNCNLLLLQSFELGPLEVFLRAHFATAEVNLNLTYPSFDTLGMALRTYSAEHYDNVCSVLLPWDLCGALNWRTGITQRIKTADILAEVQARLEDIAQWPGPKIYLPAPLPPMTNDHAEDEFIAFTIKAMISRMGGIIASDTLFSLSPYLRSGVPVSGNSCDDLARLIFSATSTQQQTQFDTSSPAKIVCTDLDNTLWSGIIGEDGPDGIMCANEGKGFIHFIYQSALKRLQEQGVLLAAITRNSAELALSPFQSDITHLTEDDFVSVVANYGSKSANIAQLLEELNLGEEAVVFVDDNPLEIEEVAHALPKVRCLQFPHSEAEFPQLIAELYRHFHINVETNITQEDLERTQLYRTRLAGLTAQAESGSDLAAYLKDLSMRLTIHNRSQSSRTRAIQLINKTNQFNLNGIRWTDEEITACLENGGKLYTAELEDRHGNHGEILACLIDSNQHVHAFVMSCRVFERRVEYHFTRWLVDAGYQPTFQFLRTDRNQPIQIFFGNDGFARQGDHYRIQPEHLSNHFSKENQLIHIRDLSGSS